MDRRGTRPRCGDGARAQCTLATWCASSGGSLRLVVADATIVRRMMIPAKLNDAVPIDPPREASHASFRPIEMDITS